MVLTLVFFSYPVAGAPQLIPFIFDNHSNGGRWWFLYRWSQYIKVISLCTLDVGIEHPHRSGVERWKSNLSDSKEIRIYDVLIIGLHFKSFLCSRIMASFFSGKVFWKLRVVLECGDDENLLASTASNVSVQIRIIAGYLIDIVREYALLWRECHPLLLIHGYPISRDDINLTGKWILLEKDYDIVDKIESYE